MPRVEDTFIKSIIYLYPTLEDAQNARSYGATGFLLCVPFERTFDDKTYYHAGYLVTNAHNIEEGVKALRLNRLDGGSECIDMEGWKWYFHPNGDDIAIIPFTIDSEVYDHLYNPSEFFITQEFIDEHKIGMGDECYIIGRFRYHEGRKRNYPTARFGYIAQMPDEPIIKATGGLTYTDKQEAFLVEMRSISGYSGAPVFLWLPPYTYRVSTGKPIDGKFYTRLLGVDFGHLPVFDPIVDYSGNRITDMEVKGNSAMAGVVPAWKLRELLDLEDLIQMRRDKEEKFAKERAEGGYRGIVLDVAPRDVDTADDEEIPSTKEEFEHILRRVSRPDRYLSDDKDIDQ